MGNVSCTYWYEAHQWTWARERVCNSSKSLRNGQKRVYTNTERRLAVEEGSEFRLSLNMGGC